MDDPILKWIAGFAIFRLYGWVIYIFEADISMALLFFADELPEMVRCLSVRDHAREIKECWE